LTRKTSRQLSELGASATSVPASTGPATVARLMTIPMPESSRGRSSSGAARTMPSTCGATKPAETPCSTLKAIRKPMLGATAHSSDDSAKAKTARPSTFGRPQRSPTPPATTRTEA
jgi:hypothetical protein